MGTTLIWAEGMRTGRSAGTLGVSGRIPAVAAGRAGVQLDGYVAGDDAEAKATVLELVASIGLSPVDVGPLGRSRQLEGLAFLNITLNITNGGSWQSAWKPVGAPVPTAAAA
jgi:hypothetical protein